VAFDGANIGVANYGSNTVAKLPQNNTSASEVGEPSKVGARRAEVVLVLPIPSSPEDPARNRR